jgi:hypothetical protein
MKNKNNMTPEEIIEIATQYENLTSNIYKALNELKKFMNKPEYSEAVEVLYTEDEAYEGAALAVENANMNGEFSCFIQDLSKTWARE